MTLDTKETIKSLNSLIQLDIDAVFAYRQAIDEITEHQIKEKLFAFQGEHENHIRTLSEKVRQYGGEPPEFSRDIKGFLIEGFTAVRSMTGTKGALNAMETNEKLTNKTYEKHAGMDYPMGVAPIVEKFLGDERKHLQYIQEMLQVLSAKAPSEKVQETMREGERRTPGEGEESRRL